MKTAIMVYLLVLATYCTAHVFGADNARSLRKKKHHKRHCHSGYATFTATFDEAEPLANGFEGEFMMDICNEGGRAQYDIDAEGNFGATTQLNYHLHSAYNDLAKTGELGGAGTGGHYDPTFRCGSASSNKADTTRCAANYPNNGYELGDLSGRNGKLSVNNGRINTNVHDDNDDIPRPDDWSINGLAAGSQYSSVVFHKCDTTGCSTRLFGARLIKNCEADVFRAVLDGNGINKGVTGEFTMTICKDGSFAVYEGDFDHIDTHSVNLNYHLHSAFNSVAKGGELGGTGTGGHYDPFFKCGGASSYKTSPLCEGNYPNNGYELGDLSGKNGKIATTGTGGDKSAVFRVVDKNPPRTADYHEEGRTDYGDTFSSVVFHCDTQATVENCGTRVFGAELKKCRKHREHYHC